MKPGFLLSGFVLLLLAAYVSAQPAAPPADTWTQLPNTALYPAIPSEAKSGGGPGGTPELWSPQSLFAYSGGDIGQLPGSGNWGFFIWGGGHAATADNSLYWLPFDGTGARRLTGPYLAPDREYKYDSPWETYRSVSRNQLSSVAAPGAPKSRHTYSSLLFITVKGRPAVFAYGGSLNVGSGGGTNAARIFDLSQTYAEAMARPDMGWALKATAPAPSVASSSGWDPVKKRVVTRGSKFIGAYYPDEDRWEDWQIRGASFCCDYHASVAMDIAGRKMYVLGERLVEVIDLDSKGYTNLSGKPWAGNFLKMAWQGGYAPGPGVSWHARTKQIVVWVGGNSLILINPTTDAAKTVTMGGATVTAAEGSGTYGRFRCIPDKDQVVLLNAVDQNVLIGTVPFEDGARRQ
jgi:hypothetical protein